MPRHTDVNNNPYTANGLHRFGHYQTIVPTLLRRVEGIHWQRQRIELTDGDFIDLDWLTGDHQRLVLLCHGLEGSSDTHYMKGMARACQRAGWDVVAYHFRGCSGEPNRLARSYHSGATEDLVEVIAKVMESGRYRQLALIGFSLGGNLLLKYLGEPGHNYPQQLVGGVAISPPCDLAGCCELLNRRHNWIYQKRFLHSLMGKVRTKQALIKSVLKINQLPRCQSIREFDEFYTAPLHGFDSADDYYQRNSSRQFLPSVYRPALLISARNDPLLSEHCYPDSAEVDNELLYLLMTDHGGHVSFMQRHPDGHYWAEAKAVEFLATVSE